MTVFDATVLRRSYTKSNLPSLLQNRQAGLAEDVGQIGFKDSTGRVWWFYDETAITALIANGVPAQGIWKGSVTSSATLPATPSVDDVYVVENTSSIVRWSGSAWVAIGKNGNLVYRGDWTSGTSYQVDNIVTYGSALFICTTATNGTQPPLTDVSHWDMMLSAGTGGSEPTTACIFVSNSGSDSNDGLTPSTPKLTLSASYELAQSIYDTTFVHQTIVCRDASQFTEQCYLTRACDLYAPNAVVIGNVALFNGASVKLSRVYTENDLDSVYIGETSGGWQDRASIVDITTIENVAVGGRGVVKSDPSCDTIVRVGKIRLVVNSGVSYGVANFGAHGKLVLDVGKIYIKLYGTAECSGVINTSSSEIIGTIGEIVMVHDNGSGVQSPTGRCVESEGSDSLSDFSKISLNIGRAYGSIGVYSHGVGVSNVALNVQEFMPHTYLVDTHGTNNVFIHAGRMNDRPSNISNDYTGELRIGSAGGVQVFENDVYPDVLNNKLFAGSGLVKTVSTGNLGGQVMDFESLASAREQASILSTGGALGPNLLSFGLIANSNDTVMSGFLCRIKEESSLNAMTFIVEYKGLTNSPKITILTRQGEFSFTEMWKGPTTHQFLKVLVPNIATYLVKAISLDNKFKDVNIVMSTTGIPLDSNVPITGVVDLSSGGTSDTYKVKTNASDVNAGFLGVKLEGGYGITVEEVEEEGDDWHVKIDADFVAGNNITFTEMPDGSVVVSSSGNIAERAFPIINGDYGLIDIAEVTYPVDGDFYIEFDVLFKNTSVGSVLVRFVGCVNTTNVDNSSFKVISGRVPWGWQNQTTGIGSNFSIAERDIGGGKYRYSLSHNASVGSEPTATVVVINGRVSNGATVVWKETAYVSGGVAIGRDFTYLDFGNSVPVVSGKDDTGFAFPSLVNLSYNPTTRQVTLTGTLEAYWRKMRVFEFGSSWTSSAHADNAGAEVDYFLYFNGTSFVWSSTPWAFTDLMIAYIHRGQFNVCLRECHGLMDWRVHEQLHYGFGTALRSGGDLSGFVLNSTVPANRRPLTSQAIVVDEDLATTVPAWSVETYTQLRLVGAGAVATEFLTQADIVPVTANQPSYNQFTGGAWTQTLIPNNSYAKVFEVALPVSSNTECQEKRTIWIQPQAVSSSLTTIQALSPASLSLGSFGTAVPELVFINEVIIRYTGGDWVWISSSKLTGSRFSQVATPVPQVDEKVKVSSADTTTGYLEEKIVAGTNITITKNNAGGNETLTISSTGGSGGTANKEISMRYYKTFAGGSQLPNPFDTNPLMTDIAGNDTSANGGLQGGMSSFRGAFIAPATMNKVTVSGYLRPYRIGSNVPTGQTLTFTLHFIETQNTTRTVITTQAFTVVTTEALNQNQGQQASNPVKFSFDATLATALTQGKVMGLSITSSSTDWGVIGDVALTINFRAE
jgi:hypothetical protein